MSSLVLTKHHGLGNDFLVLLDLAGAEPVDAVRLQLVLLWSIFGSIAIATLIATRLAYRNFFTSAHQLRDPPAP